jgi:hypothetical protein
MQLLVVPASRAFVTVNCASIPRDLIASELFGHELIKTPSPTLGSLYSFRQLANFANYSVRQPS